MNTKIKNFDDLLLYSDLMALVEVADEYSKNKNFEYIDEEETKSIWETLNAIEEFEQK